MTDTATTRPEGRRRRVGRLLVLAVVLAVIGAVAGALVGLRLGSVHTATASVLVTPLTGNPYSPTGTGTSLVNLETEAQLVSSSEVVSSVQQKVGGDVSALQSGVTVTVPSNTQILTIDYASKDSAQSVRVAQAFAESYLDFRVRRATALIQGQVDQINTQIASLEKQQSKLGDRLDKLKDKGSGEASVLRAQIESATGQLDQLKANLADLQSTSLDPGQVITPAALPAAAAVPAWALGALAGLLAGAVIGVLLGSISLARRPTAAPEVHGVADGAASTA